MQAIRMSRPRRRRLCSARDPSLGYMKHTWSDLNRKWDGFHSGEYCLDLRVFDLPLTKQRVADGKREEAPTTVREIYDGLVGKNVESEFGVVNVNIRVDAEELTVTGPSFNCQILDELLRLRNDGCLPLAAWWFYFDHESSREDPQDLYDFFVVFNDGIIRESVTFRDYPGSGFLERGMEPVLVPPVLRRNKNRSAYGP